MGDGIPRSQATSNGAELITWKTLKLVTDIKHSDGHGGDYVLNGALRRRSMSTQIASG